MDENNNLSFEKLADWVEGRLSATEGRRVEDAVLASPEAQADVAWLRAFLVVSEETVLASPPPLVHEELIEAFEEYAENKRQAGLFERLVARLDFDSNLRPAFGFRSAGTAQSRQLVYAAGTLDVALDLRREPGEEGLLTVEGQVLGETEEGPRIFGVRMSGREDTATDDLGRFVFEAVAPGAYDLRISAAGLEILISSIELRL